MQFGRWKTTRGEYGTALDKLIAVLNTAQSTEESLLYIRQNFHFLEWYGGSTWGEVLVTGYFEPVIPGSLTRTAQFSQALYARPKDLVTIDLKQFSPRFKDEATLRARIKDTQVLPYFSRTGPSVDIGLAIFVTKKSCMGAGRSYPLTRMREY